MCTWDIGFNELVDDKLVARYVAEAMVLRRKTDGSNSNLYSLGLAAPARRALVNAKILKISDLAKRTESSVSQLHGMGPSAMKLLKVKMKSKKVTFKP